ncbi:ester hydrolase C11orf54 homolog isoform X2 [Helicoverpa armigera]
MASVDYKKVPIKEKPLFQPPLQEIVDVLSAGLTSTFETVSVSAEDSPDLTQSPYNLTSPGLTGNARLVEIGGPPYLLPLVQRDKLYDLAALAQHLHRDPALLAGAGAGPWPHLGVNCEGIINLSIRNGTVDQGTRIVSVEPVGAAKGSSGYLQRQLPNTETRTALLGNYLLSEGKPGKVIKVVAKKRIGPSNFITAIRETLKNHYGDKVVGLGGMFLLRAGKVKFHVMPDFSSTALCTDEDVDSWLHFFEMSAPITHVGTLVTGDHGLDLRVQHFHGFSAHGDGGHYHYDTTPEEVQYEGYFALASHIIRVDAPEQTHAVGRD